MEDSESVEIRMILNLHIFCKNRIVKFVTPVPRLRIQRCVFLRPFLQMLACISWVYTSVRSDNNISNPLFLLPSRSSFPLNTF